MTTYHAGNPPPDDVLQRFLIESLGIEGIHREPTVEEMDATRTFMCLFSINLEALVVLQAVYAPGMPLRSQPGMNVRVGRHMPPLGGPVIKKTLNRILDDMAWSKKDAYQTHIAFETLHPFLDGNGRTGRALWAWQMNAAGHNAFALPFLHRFYYQALEHSDGRRLA